MSASGKPMLLKNKPESLLGWLVFRIRGQMLLYTGWRKVALEQKPKVES